MQGPSTDDSTQPRTSKKKPSIIGQRTITGQVVKIDRAGWAHIEVTACTVEPAPQWARPIVPLDNGEAIRRHRGKIGQDKVERLLWSDESARAAVMDSRFVRI